MCCECTQALWFAQNSLPLWWQRQPLENRQINRRSCDLLKIHYLCGDKDNATSIYSISLSVVICSKFITFVVTKTTIAFDFVASLPLWFAQNSLPLWWQRQQQEPRLRSIWVVICSKFITFVVTKTTNTHSPNRWNGLWFAQNSLPLWWQRQLKTEKHSGENCCDLLKIHYLCGDKDNTTF